MSKDSTLSRPHCRAMSAAKIAPPAGPDSTSRTGKRIAVSTVVSPPPDSIRNSGQAKPSPRSWRVEAGEIARHQRLDIGVGAGGREALVLAHLGRDLARQRDRHAGQPRGEDLARCAARAPGWRRRAGSRSRRSRCRRLRAPAQRRHRRLVERHAARRPWRVDALGHGEAQVARHQRRRQLDVDVVLLEAVLVAPSRSCRESPRW